MPRQAPPPETFAADERKVWNAAQKQLRAQGTWRDVDRELLATYCRNVVAAREARVVAASEPYVEGSAAQPVAHPAIKVAREAESDARAAAEALLLTPSARRRAGLDSAPDETPADWMPVG
jgi:P27 family predicted phage terminase small subunit